MKRRSYGRVSRHDKQAHVARTHASRSYHGNWSEPRQDANIGKHGSEEKESWHEKNGNASDGRDPVREYSPRTTGARAADRASSAHRDVLQQDARNLHEAHAQRHTRRAREIRSHDVPAAVLDADQPT